MSENLGINNEQHMGVLHPSRPSNRELDQNESRSTVASGPNEDEDITLAKILQEQERAFLELRGMSALENVPPGLGGVDDEVERFEDREEGMTDEELAWKLMQEEQHAFQERMMAMAGMSVGTSRDIGIVEEEVNGEDTIDPDTLTYEELTTLGEMAGTVAAGLTDEQLQKLPRKQYTQIRNLDDPCVICQVDFEPSDDVIELPCRHVYHPDCIHPWLRAKKTCPHCSREVLFYNE